MKKLTKYALVALMLAFGASVSTSSAEAGYGYMICYHVKMGGTKCNALPRNYKIPGIKRPKRPNTVSFRVTRMLLNCGLARYVDTSMISIGGNATVYSPK